MNALLRIRVQKLFAIAVFIKVVSALLGWYLQLQWSLGLALPLLVMVAYITLGLKRQDRDVTDEKFADSCYYLGFIFTITSIVFSLFDLPHIGDRIQDIAVRFGAAMVSTVLGLAVRVYLVSFRPDSSDALKDTEDAVLEAAQKFREQLVMAYEKLGDFQSQVTAATQRSVESVKLQVEKLTEDHSARMERVFVELNQRNQDAVTQALSKVSSASTRMALAIESSTESMNGSLHSLGDKVDSFGDAVTKRLKNTTFPDDYFASRLAAPLEQLKAASAQMSEHVQSAATGATEAATVLSVAIRKLKAKTEQAEESLDTVVRLTTAQHSLFDTSAAQLERLQRLGDLLDQVQKALEASTMASAANATSNEEVQGRVTAVVLAVEASQKAVVEAIGKLLTRQGVEQDAASSLERQVQSAEAATKELTNELRNNFAVAQRLAAKLEAEASPQPQLIAVVGELQAQRESMSEVLSSIDRKASSASIEAAAAVAQLRGVGERLDELVSRLVARPPLPEISGITGPGSSVTAPSQQSVAQDQVLPHTPIQLPADSVGRSAALLPPVAHFTARPAGALGSGAGNGADSGIPQG